MLVELAEAEIAGGNAVTEYEPVAVAWLKCPSPAYVARIGYAPAGLVAAML
jgi:hypothetical protein